MIDSHLGSFKFSCKIKIKSLTKTNHDIKKQTSYPIFAALTSYDRRFCEH